MRKAGIALVILAAAALIALSQSFFTVRQDETAIVMQFGEPVSGPLEPGAHFKVPFIQRVVYFDTRILDYEARRADVHTLDGKVIVLDSYVRWRIRDPLLFYKTVRTQANALPRLNDTVYSALINQVNQHTLTQIVSGERNAIMEKVTALATREAMKEYGIQVVDVRIKRADLPAQNQEDVFRRMRTDREREARQYRADGAREATVIRSEADRDYAIIVAQARAEAERIRAGADAKVTRIYGEAFSKSPAFYDFRRSLEAYRNSFQNGTRIILPEDAPLLRHFMGGEGSLKGGGAKK